MAKTIDIEGLSPDEILALPDDELDVLAFTDDPIAFRIGTANILAHFRKNDDALVLELAHIDGGGEGVLPLLGALARRYAQAQSLSSIEWLVHATNCADPNPKLKRVLEKRGFVIKDIAGVGDVYYSRDDL